MSKNKLTKIVIWLIAVLLVTLALIWFWLAGAINAGGTRTSQVRFVIESGQGVNAIASNLKEQGIISTERLFTMGAMLESASVSLQAGEYLIPANASIKDLVVLFSAGTTDEEITVRIKEEAKLEKIAEDIEEQTGISKEDFLTVAQTTDITEIFPDVTFPSLSDKPDSQGLEGYLYPDTYRIFSDATAEDIIFKALINFESKLTKEDRDAIDEQGKTLHEILTLASIVEREEPNSDERRVVAGVFWNRIAVGMALQSDATVNYVTDADNPRPTLEELEFDSPYNTYQNRGLPPGPISNPTIDSIRATINYEDTDYFYFLHPQDGSGQTIYGRTLEEHNSNRLIYLP